MGNSTGLDLCYFFWPELGKETRRAPCGTIQNPTDSKNEPWGEPGTAVPLLQGTRWCVWRGGRWGGSFSFGSGYFLPKGRWVRGRIAWPWCSQACFKLLSGSNQRVGSYSVCTACSSQNSELGVFPWEGLFSKVPGPLRWHSSKKMKVPVWKFSVAHSRQLLCMRLVILLNRTARNVTIIQE